MIKFFKSMNTQPEFTLLKRKYNYNKALFLLNEVGCMNLSAPLYSIINYILSQKNKK